MENFNTFIQSIFGVYSPITEIDASGTLVSFTDWGYVASVVIFCITLYFVLKTIGGIIYEWLR